ncbi:MAG: 50S ribosomal protein L6 [Myxococcota bacterium]
MSRIGKLPIAVPDKVKISTTGRTVTVEGPKGKLDAILPTGVELAVEGSEVTVNPPAKRTRGNGGFQGLARSLVANMVHGVAEGYSRTLEINGVGYKAEMKGKTLVLTLGYSHPCELELPAGIEAKIDKGTVVTISGPDKQMVGQVAAQVRGFKVPEPYKAKGVKYADETIRRKVGKAGSK